VVLALVAYLKVLYMEKKQIQQDIIVNRAPYSFSVDVGGEHVV
jgi:hypothetical protein